MEDAESVETRLLRINSRFKQPGESNTDFTYLYAGANIIRVQLLKFSCSRLFPNVFPPYNTLNIDGQIYTVATGQYTATQLAEYLSTTLNIPCTLNASNKFQLDSTSGVVVPTRLTTILMGFPDNNFSLPAIATNYPALQGPDPIYIESTDLALSNCFDHDDSNSGSIPLVWSVPCSNVPYGFTVSWESNDAEINRIDIKNGTVSNRTFNIKITDQYGHPLVLPDNQYVDMIFKVFYEPNK